VTQPASLPAPLPAVDPMGRQNLLLLACQHGLPCPWKTCSNINSVRMSNDDKQILLLFVVVIIIFVAAAVVVVFVVVVGVMIISDSSSSPSSLLSSSLLQLPCQLPCLQLVQ
jgi:hypothetical protein